MCHVDHLTKQKKSQCSLFSCLAPFGLSGYISHAPLRAKMPSNRWVSCTLAMQTLNQLSSPIRASALPQERSPRSLLLPKLVHRFNIPGLPLGDFSSGRASRYRLTLPASESASSQWKRVRRELGGSIQSGTSLMKNPRNPRLAASIAAYSNRRLASEVQY